jgi:hypothetical protein
MTGRMMGPDGVCALVTVHRDRRPQEGQGRGRVHEQDRVQSSEDEWGMSE